MAVSVTRTWLLMAMVALCAVVFSRGASEELQVRRCEILESLVASDPQEGNGYENPMMDLALEPINIGCLSHVLQMQVRVQSDYPRLVSYITYILSVTNTYRVVELVTEVDRDIIMSELGKESLIRAANDGRCDAVAGLLAAGVNADETDSNGKSVLEIAVQGKHLSCIMHLREHHAMQLRGTYWEKELFTAVGNAWSLEVAALLAAGVDPNVVDSEGNTPLTLAASTDCLKCVQELLLQGAEVDARSLERFNATALMWASLNGHLDIVRTLLSVGADVNAKNGYEDTAFHAAATFGHTDVMHALLEAGAEPDDTGVEDKPPAPVEWPTGTGNEEKGEA